MTIISNKKATSGDKDHNEGEQSKESSYLIISEALKTIDLGHLRVGQ